MTSKRLRVLRPLLLGFVLAGVVWAVWRLDRPHHLSVAEMRALVDSQAPYGPLVFMAIVVAGLFTRVPLVATMLIAVGALLFGKIPAFAYGWLAALVGTTAIFVLVRSVARDYVQRALQARTERLRALDDRLARNGFLTVLALRLVLGLAPLLNWGLGLSCGTFAKRYLRRRARIATSSHRRNHARLPHVQRGTSARRRAGR